MSVDLDKKASGNEVGIKFSRRVKLLELRDKKADRLIKLREIEINEELKRLELENDRFLKEREIHNAEGRGLRFSSSQATVIGAVCVLVGGVLTAVSQGFFNQGVENRRNDALIQIEKNKSESTLALERQKQSATQELERQKFETTLILKATEGANRLDQIRNLQFFIAAGFISDPNGKIANIKSEDYPSTPQQVYTTRILPRQTDGSDITLPQHEPPTPNLDDGTLTSRPMKSKFKRRRK